MRVNGGCAPVVPAQAGTSHPCVDAPCTDVGAVREPPEGPATPKHTPNPTTTAPCVDERPPPYNIR